MTRRRALALAVVCFTLSACTKVYYDKARDQTGTSVSPTAPTPTPTPVVANQIEFRIFGNVGLAPVLIKYTNTIDGLTVLSTASLPYLATVKSTDASVFLYVEAQALSLVQTSTLQVQTYVDGRLFREGYASGLGPLVASASGTFRR